jgi:hypothetical protein
MDIPGLVPSGGLGGLSLRPESDLLTRSDAGVRDDVVFSIGHVRDFSLADFRDSFVCRFVVRNEIAPQPEGRCTI